MPRSRMSGIMVKADVALVRKGADLIKEGTGVTFRYLGLKHTRC
jgi:hypothetical protein